MDLVPVVIAIFGIVGAGGFVAWRKINPEIESITVAGFEKLVTEQRAELDRAYARIDSLEERVRRLES